MKTSGLQSFLSKKISFVLAFSFFTLIAFQAVYMAKDFINYQEKINGIIRIQVMNLIYEKARVGDMMNLHRDLSKIIQPLSDLSSIHIFIEEAQSGKQIADVNFGKDSWMFPVIYNLNNVSTPVGDFNINVEVSSDEVLLSSISKIILMFVMCSFFGGFVYKFINRTIRKEIELADELLDDIKNFNFESIHNVSKDDYKNTDIKSLSGAWENFNFQLRKFNEKNIEFRANELKSNLALQVAHDIRSPLSALSILQDQIQDQSEDIRILVSSSVQRINDIANGLLEISRTGKPIVNIPQVEMLSTIVDSILSEKRIQFRNLLDLHIESSLQNAYGAFAKIVSVEIKTILSNLINNSVEAVGPSGRILVRVTRNGAGSIIEVEDNGIGIPEEMISRLGTEKLSFGKDSKVSGNGLGLTHAKSCMESLGGELDIQSKLNEGTKIILTFPPASPPLWFISCIEINKGSKVVILDDDQSIHQVWRGRLSNDILVMSFSEQVSFSNHVKTTKVSDTIFLIDFDFKDANESGLDIIESLGISKSSILVTSHSEDRLIRVRCIELGVKVLPKSMAAYIPIHYS